jgi:TonB family protein
VTPATNALATYSLQILGVVLAASATARLIRRAPARLHLLLWRLAAAACVLLPLAALTHDATPHGLATFGTADGAAAYAAPGGLTVPAAVGNVLWLAIVAGVGTRLLWLVTGAIGLRGIRRNSEPVMLSDADDTLRRRLAPHAEVRRTDRVSQPATFGLLRPTVLLPRDMAGLPDDARHAVLCHEFVHVARRDWIWLWPEELLRALLWFHPALWWLLDRLHLSREQVVDAIVVRETGARRDYMRALVLFADAAAMPLPATPMLRHRHLLPRLQHLAKEPSMSRSRMTTIALVLAATIGVVATMIALTFPLDLRAPAAQPGPSRRSAAAARTALPTVVSEERPVYTPAAMSAKIEGTVLMKVLVNADGSVGSVRVVKSLDAEHGLDDSAVAAAKRWRFRPGTREGKPVAVEVDLEMLFTLRRSTGDRQPAA